VSIHELFPTLRVKNAAEAIAFYQRVFGATEKMRLTEPSGRIGHVELLFGTTIVMLSDEYPEYGIFAPDGKTRSAQSIHLHVDDADAMIARCIAEGATLVREAQDAFYGERSGVVRDPFGHEWNIGHSIEDVSPEEMQHRYTAMMTSG
jgi:PhnB protein